MLGCLHEAESEVKFKEGEAEAERMMYATNPELWSQVYGSDSPLGEGVIIAEPATKEEFEAMMEELGLAPV